MKRFSPMPDQPEEHNRPTLRTTRPAAVYARRSLVSAKDKKKDTSQSREMQTEDLMEWAFNQGWNLGDLDPYFADLGLSGTLRPDQRPDMLRIFDAIDQGRYDHGSIICYQENRLFRDETQIYYNQFIQKCKEHDVLVIAVSPYLLIYDFQDEFLTEMFRWKCKEAADFIRRHVKGWMHPARYRAAWNDGKWAGLGHLPPGFIVDYDEKSPTHKKLIPYAPHAEKKREYRVRFVKLGCNLSLLYQSLREAPIVFPEFEPWVDRRNVHHFFMAPYPGGGYAPRDKGTVKRILTSEFDIGLRSIRGVIRRDRQGVILKDHDSIVDQELFDLCYEAVATTDFEGNPLTAARRALRYFHRGKEGAFALLKFRIKSSQEREVFAHAGGEYDEEGHPLEEGSYIIQSWEEGEFLRHTVLHAVLPCEEIDTLVVDRLLQHVKKISNNQEDIAEHEKQVRQRQAAHQRKLVQLKKSVSDVERKQGGLTRNVGNLEAEIAEAEQEGDTKKQEMKKRRKQLVEQEIETLEEERIRLLVAITELEEEAESDLGTLDEEIRKLEAEWPKYTFGKRRSLINFLVQEVVIDVLSTHWMKIEILWTHEEWGREELCWQRNIGNNLRWTPEEEELIKQHYPAMPKDHLMALLPDRSWAAIQQCGQRKGASRDKDVPAPENEVIRRARRESWKDLQVMREQKIPLGSTKTEWTYCSGSVPWLGVSALDLKKIIHALQLLTTDDKKAVARKKYA